MNQANITGFIRNADGSQYWGLPKQSKLKLVHPCLRSSHRRIYASHGNLTHGTDAPIIADGSGNI